MNPETEVSEEKVTAHGAREVRGPAWHASRASRRWAGISIHFGQPTSPHLTECRGAENVHTCANPVRMS